MKKRCSVTMKSKEKANPKNYKLQFANGALVKLVNSLFVVLVFLCFLVATVITA